MENSEYVFQLLDLFVQSKRREIPLELEEYITHVAKTGEILYQWPLVKTLLKEKLMKVLDEFYRDNPSPNIPNSPNVEPFVYQDFREHLISRLDSYSSPPFTVQRICELLSEPNKQYSRVDKYMRAVEKNVLVVSSFDIRGSVERELGAGSGDNLSNGIDYPKENLTTNDEDLTMNDDEDMTMNDDVGIVNGNAKISVDAAALESELNYTMILNSSVESGRSSIGEEIASERIDESGNEISLNENEENSQVNKDAEPKITSVENKDVAKDTDNCFDQNPVNDNEVAKVSDNYLDRLGSIDQLSEMSVKDNVVADVSDGYLDQINEIVRKGTHVATVSDNFFNEISEVAAKDTDVTPVSDNYFDQINEIVGKKVSVTPDSDNFFDQINEIRDKGADVAKVTDSYLDKYGAISEESKGDADSDNIFGKANEISTADAATVSDNYFDGMKESSSKIRDTVNSANLRELPGKVENTIKPFAEAFVKPITNFQDEIGDRNLRSDSITGNTHLDALENVVFQTTAPDSFTGISSKQELDTQTKKARLDVDFKTDCESSSDEPETKIEPSDQTLTRCEGIPLKEVNSPLEMDGKLTCEDDSETAIEGATESTSADAPTIVILDDDTTEKGNETIMQSVIPENAVKPENATIYAADNDDPQEVNSSQNNAVEIIGNKLDPSSEGILEGSSNASGLMESDKKCAVSSDPVATPKKEGNAIPTDSSCEGATDATVSIPEKEAQPGTSGEEYMAELDFEQMDVDE